jgi:hypothetical protein
MIEAVWPTAARPFFAQRLGNLPGRAGSAYDSLRFVVMRPWLTHQFLDSLHDLDAAIAIARLPWPDKLRARESLAPPFPAERQPGGTSARMGPGAEFIGAAMLRGDTRSHRTVWQWPCSLSSASAVLTEARCHPG